MFKLVLIAASLIAGTPVHAQDIVGLEDCSQAKGPDKKFGCLQSNVDFLHRLIKKNDASAQAQQKAAAASLSELRGEIDRLKLALDELEKKIPKK